MIYTSLLRKLTWPIDRFMCQKSLNLYESNFTFQFQILHSNRQLINDFCPDCWGFVIETSHRWNLNQCKIAFDNLALRFTTLTLFSLMYAIKDGVELNFNIQFHGWHKYDSKIWNFCYRRSQFCFTCVYLAISNWTFYIFT